MFLFIYRKELAYLRLNSEPQILTEFNSFPAGGKLAFTVVSVDIFLLSWSGRLQ